jgi:hypothetical protein
MSEKATYIVGKGKPPANRRFGQPEGNIPGKTSEQKRLEMQNAEAAVRIRARALHAVEAKLGECGTEEAIALLVKDAMLRLIKDSEDRGLGAPVQPMDHTTNGESMNKVDLTGLSDAALAELVAARDAAKKY